MRVLAVIPARFASTRLPGKPLSDIHGKPMIQWVYERARQAKGLLDVVVATDDEKVAQAVRSFGGKAMMTAPEIPSGTDRVAAVADEIQADVYINVQGDEPLMEPAAIEAAAELVTSGRFEMGTVMTPILDASDLENRAVVKVIADRHGRALYFSRLPIPYGREPIPAARRPSGTTRDLDAPYACRRHVGLYSYTRDTLFRIRKLPPSLLEKCEMLEQLRAMQDGISIGITEIDFTSIGVDTPEELEKVRTWLNKKNSSS